jgi:glycosyltransferase involved in cell wall biosynthesis
LTNVCKQADAIITVSECTKRDLLSMFDYKPENIFVTPLGSRFKSVDINNFSEIFNKYEIKEKKYFLFTGMISIRKNIINLIKAYKRSGLSDEYNLVLAGGMSMGHEIIIQEIEKNGLKKNIVLPGFVSDEELALLYTNAKAFLFPTYYEGFGLPIIEAMSYGIPVLIGNRGAAPEIAGSHGIQVDPFDIDSISNGISKMVDVTDNEINTAANHAKKYTWQECALKTMNVYKTVLGK